MRKQFLDPACRMRRQSLEHLLEVPVGIMPVHPNGVHETHHRVSPLARPKTARGHDDLAPAFSDATHAQRSAPKSPSFSSQNDDQMNSTAIPDRQAQLMEAMAYLETLPPANHAINQSPVAAKVERWATWLLRIELVLLSFYYVPWPYSTTWAGCLLNRHAVGPCGSVHCVNWSPSSRYSFGWAI